VRILLPGAGAKSEHVTAFRAQSGVTAVVITDLDAWAPANFVADRSYLLPPFRHPACLEHLLRLCRVEEIDVTIPIHDASLRMISENRQRFVDLSVRLGISAPETIELASDKIAVHRFFEHHGVPTPGTWTLEQYLHQRQPCLPSYLKPRWIEMRGTPTGLYAQIDSRAELERIAVRLQGHEQDYVVQPLLRGTEINIDFFTDADGEPLAIVPVRRLAMGASRGIIRGETAPELDFEPWVSRIIRGTRFWGANQIQVFVCDDGELRFTEINPRFSGSSVLVRAAGADFFTASVALLRGEAPVFAAPIRHLRMTTRAEPIFYEESPALGGEPY
jgi:carbamoyl-phosphate synthase large subunit